MRKSKRTIINAVFLGVFIATGIINVSYGQAKVDKLDKLISTYAEYGTAGRGEPCDHGVFTK